MPMAGFFSPRGFVAWRVWPAAAAKEKAADESDHGFVSSPYIGEQPP
jgi:hypothetical protein